MEVQSTLLVVVVAVAVAGAAVVAVVGWVVVQSSAKLE